MRLTDIVNINQIYGLMQHITTQLLHQFTMALFHIVFMTYRQIYLAKLINSNLPAAFRRWAGLSAHTRKKETPGQVLSLGIFIKIFFTDHLRATTSLYFNTL